MDGSFNLAGIKDPVVDALIDKVIEAKSRAELIDRYAARSTACCAPATIGCHTGTRPRTTSPSGTSIRWPAVKPKYDRRHYRHLVVRCRQSCEARPRTEGTPRWLALSSEAPAADHPDAVRDHADQLRHRAVRARRPGRARHRAAHRHRRAPWSPASAAARATLVRPTQSQLGQGAADAVTSKYRGAQGLDPEFIKSLEKQFGFDKPAYERFFLMMKNYLTVRFRQELLPRRLACCSSSRRSCPSRSRSASG